MHTQHIINTTNLEFLLPPRNTHAPFSYRLAKMNIPKYPLRPIVPGCDARTVHLSSYSTHFIQDVANILPSHIKDTEHFLNLVKNFHHSQQMHSWSQLMISTYLKTFHMMMAYKPTFISWRNTSIHYPQTAYLTIQFTEFSISFLKIAPSWTHTSAKSLAPPWEQRSLHPMPIFSWAKKNVLAVF